MCFFRKLREQLVSHGHHIGKGHPQLLGSQCQGLQLRLIGIPIHQKDIPGFLPDHSGAASDPTDL